MHTHVHTHTQLPSRCMGYHLFSFVISYSYYYHFSDAQVIVPNVASGNTSKLALTRCDAPPFVSECSLFPSGTTTQPHPVFASPHAGVSHGTGTGRDTSESQCRKRSLSLDRTCLQAQWWLSYEFLLIVLPTFSRTGYSPRPGVRICVEFLLHSRGFVPGV